jgi:4-amino-4-deoxy-L-arabinose transferase-like glycosyltransferase
LLGAIVLTALILRLVYVLTEGPDPLPFGDGLFFHVQANFLGDGHGFVNPGQLAYRFVKVPTAQHPPLFVLLLSPLSALGFQTTLAHQLACAVFSSVGVGVIGLLGRRVAGARAGLFAAGLACFYPAMWVNDALVLSESLFVLTVALALLSAYRFWDRPALGTAAQLGVAIGVAALTRAEAILFVLVIALPLSLWVGGLGFRRRGGLFAVSLLATGAVIAPWVIRNLVTFERPIFLAQNLDSVIAGANCGPSYYGPGLGSWNFFCNGKPDPPGDESQQGAEFRRRGLEYARDHLGRVPVVIAARIGRSWDVYRPLQAKTSEGRPPWVAPLTVGYFYVLQPLAIAGAVLLRRRRRPVFPLVVQALVVTFVAATAYGLQRLRVPWDVAAVVLAAVAVDAFISRAKHPRELAPAEARKDGALAAEGAAR